MKILMVLTSHEELGNSGEKTGFWIDEFATPYYVLADAGAELTLDSPKGGQPPVDPKSESADSHALIENFYKHDKSIAFVCHAPSALLKAKAPDGESLIKGKEVTCFSNDEEEAVGLSKVVPFLLEDELKRMGAKYSRGANWSFYFKQDGLIITGQNPASSGETGKLLLAAIEKKAENRTNV
jgi:putative intracellular protease/amidase